MVVNGKESSLMRSENLADIQMECKQSRPFMENLRSWWWQSEH